jgi:hypothetical protein
MAKTDAFHYFLGQDGEISGHVCVEMICELIRSFEIEWFLFPAFQ